MKKETENHHNFPIRSFRLGITMGCGSGSYQNLLMNLHLKKSQGPQQRLNRNTQL